MQPALGTLKAGTKMAFLMDSTWVQLKRVDLEPFQISLKSYPQNCEVTQGLVHLVPTAEGGSISQQMEANVLPTGQAVQCGSLQSAHETTHEKNSQL